MRGVDKRIIYFAENRGAEAVCLGCNPEEGKQEVYYIIIPGKHDSRLEDDITRLELEIMNSFGVNVSIMRWPTSYEQATEQGFMGKTLYRSQ